MDKAIRDTDIFEHGQEGTHFACQEQLAKYGGKTKCCGCSNHHCQPDPAKTKLIHRAVKAGVKQYLKTFQLLKKT